MVLEQIEIQRDLRAHIPAGCHNIPLTPPPWTLPDQCKLFQWAVDPDPDRPEVPMFSEEFFIKKNEWYQVDMATFEGRFDFWLNGRVLVSYKDPDPLSSGSINMSIYGIQNPEQTIYYDNLVICELTKPYQTLSETE